MKPDVPPRSSRISLLSLGLLLAAGLASAAAAPALATAAPSSPAADPVRVFAGQAPAPDSPLALWYRRPATRWLEALPVGNGRLAAMVFGNVGRERLALNESTFWSGGPCADHENPEGRVHLAEIRSLLFAGEYRKGVGLIRQHLLGRQKNYGTHLPVGDLLLDLTAGDGPVRDYRRSLDLKEGIAAVRYSIDGVQYRREVFVSHPDGVIVMRLTADRPGRISFLARFRAERDPARVRCEGGDTLVVSADAREDKHSDGKSGVTLAGRIRVLPEGGAVRATGEGIELARANAATVLVSLNTTFGNAEPDARCVEALRLAAPQGYGRLRRRHLADHRSLFDRVAIDLGRSGGEHLPTDERLARLRRADADPALAALFFQYGRYLLIAGSRSDSPLPANLQGIWNDNLACSMGWTCDYHLDINTQQNYWPAETANLSECHEPLLRLVESLREPGRRTARTVYGASGWVCHVFTNPWGFTAPGWWLGWGMHTTGGSWIASHLWEHYLFTGDREFLRRRAYPTLKEAAEFFLDYMVVEPTHGWLVTGPSTSPENTFVAPNGQGRCSESMGPTCDVVLVRDLFVSCIEGSRILGEDAGFRARLEAALEKFPPLRVGRHGQLMEWLEDFEEADPGHRHTTHLIALHPSHQIDPRRTPELAKAAAVTLQRRLAQPNWEDVEWSRGNLINFQARLGHGEEAHRHLLGLLREDTEADLLTFSRGGIAGAEKNIFAVDGNCAGTSGITEMLLQSRAAGGGAPGHHGLRSEIELLPALPQAWPNGTVKGLRARGGYEVDVSWRKGAFKEARLRSLAGGVCLVRLGEHTLELKLAQGASRRIGPRDFVDSNRP